MPPEQTSPTFVSPSQDKKSTRLKALLFIALSLAAIALVIFLLGQIGKASIEVRVDSDSDSEITYRFVNQESQDTTEIQDTSKQITARLPEGSYELTVLQDNTSYFSLVNIGETGTVNAVPVTEKGRAFIGNLPRRCLHAVDSILLSYGCGEALDSLQTHVPATADLPTFTEQTFTPAESIIEGFARTSTGQQILLLREVEDFAHVLSDDTPHAAHSVYSVRHTGPGAKMEIVDSQPLPDLKEDQQYSITPFRSGFIIYNEDITEAFYYDSPGANPSTLATPDQGTSYELNAKGDAYLVASTIERQSVVTVYDSESNETSYTLDRAFEKVRLCGEQNLCGLSGNSLEVYDLSGPDPELLYTVSDVQDIENLGSRNRILAVRSNGVLDLDVNTRSGSMQYTFGDYKYCGIQPNQSSYLLCITNPGDDSSVLTIDQDQESDSIDRKVSDLLELVEVKTVSIYNDLIFISPEAGEVEYIPEIEGYGYDPAQLEKINNVINRSIEEIGINTSKYTIKNILGNE